jgi:signal transduction histidine kinase
MRNALAPLLLLVDAFEVDRPGDPPDRRLGMLHRNLRRLLGVVERVGAVAQLRDDKLVLDPQEVDLDDVIVDVVAELARDAHVANLEVRVAPVHVVGRWDVLRLTQIIRQLLSNAVRHSGGRVVEISIAVGDQVHVTFADDGRGIEPGRRATLFEFTFTAE